MKRIIQAILFDLGDTLMYSPDPWAPVFEHAGHKLSFVLCSNGLQIDCETFHLDFLQRLDQYYADRDRNLIETTTMTVLQELLTEKGHPGVPEKLLRIALDEFYAATQQNWHLENDAIATLVTLQNSGFHLGLVSNAGDERDVLQQVDKFGIRPYFDFILTSAACGYRKPHPHIFGLALDQWGYLPDEIAMVGDRLDADISGARPLGIYTIWIKRRAKKLFSANAAPDATIESLSEIPPLVINLWKSE
ncbi:MAG: HAD family hydrolase [Chloroflexi bacterium]|nr:HAD family hydrolase [Chloroflexota bacterium]